MASEDLAPWFADSGAVASNQHVPPEQTTPPTQPPPKPSDAMRSGLPLGAWGFPLVKGHCPACGAQSLFLAVGGYVTCSVIGCPNPTMVADLLEVDPRAANSQARPE